MTKKSIEFKQDVNSFLKRANLRYEKGDYPSALSFLYRAQALMPKDTEIGLEIAFLYGEMGLFDEELRHLFLLMHKGREDMEVYKEIIKCYFEMELFDQSIYYYKEALELGVFDDDYLDELFDVDYDGDFSDIKLRDKRDKSNLLQLSHKLMRSGDLEFAKQLMESISTDSYQYIEATNSLAVIALSFENAQNAIDYSSKVLEIDEDNVYALAHSIIAFDLLGDHQKKQEYTEHLLSLDFSGVTELAVAAFSMHRIHNNELSVHFLEKLLRFAPYSREHLITCAIANSNCGNKQRARELLVRANNVFPNDVVVKYYSKLIIASEEKTNFEIMFSLPEATAREWVGQLESFIKSSQDNLPKIDAETKDKILWAFGRGDFALKSNLAKILVKDAEWEQHIRRLLVDPCFDYRAKKDCLQSLLLTSKKKEFNLFINDVFLTFKPKIPQGSYREEFTLAYWQAYATLAFIGGDFDARLNKCFKHMIGTYKDTELSSRKLDSRVLSALLLFRVNVKHVFKNKVDCCEIFDCDLTDFDTYNEVLPAQATRRKK